MAGVDTKHNYWSKVHDCTKISHEFMSEKKCALRRVFKKNLLLKKSIKNKPLGCYDKPVLVIIAAHVAEVHNGLPVGHWGLGAGLSVGSDAVPEVATFCKASGVGAGCACAEERPGNT